MIARALVLACVVLCAACGGDDDAPAPMTDGGTDSRVMGGDAGPAPMCGSHHCGSPLLGEHCCTTPADVSAGVALASPRCGADLSDVVASLSGRCVELRQAGSLDTDCPARTVGTRVEPGCCTSEGVCGNLNEAADLGWQRLFSTASAPIACSAAGQDAGAGHDAGM